MRAVLDRCLRETELYIQAGVDGLIVENTHDTPYQRVHVDPGVVAGMAVAAHEVRKRCELPIGIQILAGADVAAVDVAITCGLDFIRAEGFAYAHVADEGLIQGDAARILRRRAHIGATHVEVWADVKKKHASHAVTNDLSLRAEAKGAVYCGADGVIVTGGHTGEAPEFDDLKAVADLGVRVVVGSGVNATNIRSFSEFADVLIVGSACKEGDTWRGAVDLNRVRLLVGLLRDGAVG